MSKPIGLEGELQSSSNPSNYITEKTRSRQEGILSRLSKRARQSHFGRYVPNIGFAAAEIFVLGGTVVISVKAFDQASNQGIPDCIPPFYKQIEPFRVDFSHCYFLQDGSTVKIGIHQW